MDIPVRNIYYLLSYAWNQFTPATWERFGTGTYTHIIQFYGWWLLHHIEKILHKETPSRYQLQEGSVVGIRGKINVSETLRRQLHRKGQTYCRYFTIHNDRIFFEILTSTIYSVIRSEQIDPKLRSKLQQVNQYLAAYDEIPLHSDMFTSMQKKKYNVRQRAVLHVCELIYHQKGIESNGTYHLTSLLVDAQKLPMIFERFIRNFYRRHAVHFQSVGREYIPWNVEKYEGTDHRFPRMETDVSLISNDKKIIIETKYMKEVLQKHYFGGNAKFHSKHLYQLFSYLKNIEAKDMLSQSCQGILLYPSIDVQLDEYAEISGHIVRIFTLDLNRSWEHIHKDLMKLID